MNDMKDGDSNILARIDERTQQQTVSFALHVKDDADTKRETSEKFDKVFNFMTKRFDKIDDKLDTLWDEKNERKGAFSASKLITGGIWGMVILAVGYFIPKHGV